MRKIFLYNYVNYDVITSKIFLLWIFCYCNLCSFKTVDYAGAIYFFWIVKRPGEELRDDVDKKRPRQGVFSDD